MTIPSLPVPNKWLVAFKTTLVELTLKAKFLMFAISKIFITYCIKIIKGFLICYSSPQIISNSYDENIIDS